MTKMPPIPDAAMAAAADNICAEYEEAHDEQVIVAIRAHHAAELALAAAWPHLYAAALRDAASRWGAEVPISEAWFAPRVTAALHRMADEAVQ